MSSEANNVVKKFETERDKSDASFQEISTDSSKRPGRLKSKASILLQTVPGQNVFANNPICVKGFSYTILRLLGAVRKDDPYADSYLLKIYQHIVKTRGMIQRVEKKYLKILQKADGVCVEPSLTDEPISYPLAFSNPYSFMCTYLVSDFDRLMRILITAKYLFLIDTDRYLAVSEAVKNAIRKVLAMPLEWKYTGVTRYDVYHNTQVAQRAEKRMRGALNEKVLSRESRAPFAPFVEG